MTIKQKIRKGLQTAGLVAGLALSPLALKAQEPTNVSGTVNDAQTEQGINGVTLEGIMQDTTAGIGFSAASDALGFWSALDIPIKKPTSVHVQEAQDLNKMRVSYENGHIRFTINSNDDLGDMNIVDVTGRTVGHVRFQEQGFNTWEAVWNEAGKMPEGVMLLQGKNHAAKFYTGDFADGFGRYQETELVSKPVKKAAQANEDLTDYLVQARHPDYQPKDTLVSFQHYIDNMLDIDMSKWPEYVMILNSQDDKGIDLPGTDWQVVDPTNPQEILFGGNTGANALDTLSYIPKSVEELEALLKTSKEGYSDAQQEITLKPGELYVVSKNAVLDVLYNAMVRAQDDGTDLDHVNVHMYDANNDELLDEANSGENTVATVDHYAAAGGLPARFVVKRPGYEQAENIDTLSEGDNQLLFVLLKNLYEGNLKIQTEQGEPLDSANIYLVNRDNDQVLLDEFLGSETSKAFSQRIAQELLDYELQASRQGYESNFTQGRWRPGNNDDAVVQLEKITVPLYNYMIDINVINDFTGENASHIEAVAKDPNTGEVLATDNSLDELVAELDFISKQAGSKNVEITVDALGYQKETKTKNALAETQNNYTYFLQPNIFTVKLITQDSDGQPLDQSRWDLDDKILGEDIINVNMQTGSQYSIDIAKAVETFNLVGTVTRDGYKTAQIDAVLNPTEQQLIVQLEAQNVLHNYLKKLQATNTQGAYLNNLELELRDPSNGSLLGEANSGGETAVTATAQSYTADELNVKWIIDAPGYEAKSNTELLQEGVLSESVVELLANLYAGTWQFKDGNGNYINNFSVRAVKDGTTQELFDLSTNDGAIEFAQRYATDDLDVDIYFESTSGNKTIYDQDWDPGSNNNTTAALAGETPTDDYAYTKQAEARDADNNNEPVKGLELVVRDTDNSFIASDNSGSGTLAQVDFTDKAENEKAVKVIVDAQGYEAQTHNETLVEDDNNYDKYNLRQNLFEGYVRARNNGQYLDSLDIEVYKVADGKLLFSFDPDGRTQLNFSEREPAEPDMDVDIKVKRNGYQQKTARRNLEVGDGNNEIIDLVEVSPDSYEFAKEATATDNQNSNAPITGLDLVVKNMDGSVADTDNSGDGQLARAEFFETSTNDVQKIVVVDAQGYEAETHTETLKHGQNNRLNYGLQQNQFSGIFRATDGGSALDSVWVKVRRPESGSYLIEISPNGETQRSFSEREPMEPDMDVEIEMGRNNYKSKTFTDTWEVGSDNSVVRELEPKAPTVYDYKKQARAKSTQSGADLKGVELLVEETNGDDIGSNNSGGGQIAEVSFSDPTPTSKDVRVTVDANGYEQESHNETLTQGADNLKTYDLDENNFYGTIYAVDKNGQAINGLEVLVQDITSGTENFVQGSVSDNSYEFSKRKAREPMQVKISVSADGYQDKSTTDTWEDGHANNITLTLEEIAQALTGSFRGAIFADNTGFVPGNIRVVGQDVSYDVSATTTQGVPYHDFEDIPIDDDGQSELVATVSQTSFPFATEQYDISIIAGSNDLQRFDVEAVQQSQGKHVRGSVILGQTGGASANGVRVVVRDENNSVVYDQVVSGNSFETPQLGEGTSGKISVYYPTNDPQNRDDKYYGIAQAPFSIGSVNGDNDIYKTINTRLTPITMKDPKTGSNVTTTATYITDMEGGSYNRSFWDNGIEDVYIADNIDVTHYNNVVNYINSTFGINIRENRVDSPIEGSNYGTNIYDDGTGAHTFLRYSGGGHIGANIYFSNNFTSDVKERLLRWYEFNDVTTRSGSFGNTVASLPDALDRVIVYEFFDHQKAKNSGKATYRLYYIKKPSDGGF